MKDSSTKSLLDDAKGSRTEFERADRLSRLAAKVGFDWDSALAALEKVEEEVGEFREVVESDDADAIIDEMGDLLFAVLNVARKANIDPQLALRRTNEKFVRRFRQIEASVAASEKDWEEFSLDELEAIWISAKNDERPA